MISDKQSWVYILKCADGSYYTGCTTNLEKKQIKGWNRRKEEALINGDFELLHSLAECKNETNYKNKNY